MATNHDRRRAVTFETPHRTQPCLQATVIGFNPVVRVLGGVMMRRHQLDDRSCQCRRPVSGHHPWPPMRTNRRAEEPARSLRVTLDRHEHVDDLPVLVNSPVHIPPHPGHFHVGFVDEPAVPDTVPTRTRGLDQYRREALHPPVQGDVVDHDSAFRERLFEITIRQPVAQIPAHREQDHLRRNPETSKRRHVLNDECSTTSSSHTNSLVDHEPAAQIADNATEPSKLQVGGARIARSSAARTVGVRRRRRQRPRPVCHRRTGSTDRMRRRGTHVRRLPAPTRPRWIRQHHGDLHPSIRRRAPLDDHPRH